MKFETLDVQGFYPAMKGMRNPLKSYEKGDTHQYPALTIGKNDLDLAQRLWKAGTEHRKYLRMIQVWVDIWAPRYFWSEWDTYKVATVANSESTMHKILEEDFDEQDFEWPDFDLVDSDIEEVFRDYLNVLRTIKKRYQEHPESKNHFLKMLKGMLPESFIQKRTVCLNYETLATMYKQRKNHRLPQWSKVFVEWVHTLPYNELITGDFDG